MSKFGEEINRRTCLSSVLFPAQLQGFCCQPPTHFSLKASSYCVLAVLLAFPLDPSAQHFGFPLPVVTDCRKMTRNRYQISN